MAQHKVVISISYGDVEQPKYTQTTHIMSYDEVSLTADSAKTLTNALIGIVTGIKEKATGQPVFGIYKEEKPQEQSLQ